MRGLSAPRLVGASFRRRRAFPPPATLTRRPPSRGGRVTGRRRSAARFLRLDVQREVRAYTRRAQAFPRSYGHRWRRSRASSSRSAEFSFWASSSRRALTLGVVIMARPQSLSLAGRARNTDSTHPRASSGARSAVSGPFPEASVADMAASLICPRLGPIHGGGAGPDASGVVACSPRRCLRRVDREAPIDRRFASASIEPI